MTEVRSLLWDYVVFILFVIASTFVAVYSRCFGPKENTKADFVFAAGKVSMAAMMLSIARGTLGVRSFLGYPSELVYRGSTMWETLYGMILAYPIVCYVFVPVYFSLGITSVYQYLDLRFNSRLVRCLASATYIIRQLLNQGVTVFTPCVALNTIIGLPYWASICGIRILLVRISVSYAEHKVHARSRYFYFAINICSVIHNEWTRSKELQDKATINIFSR